MDGRRGVCVCVEAGGIRRFFPEKGIWLLGRERKEQARNIKACLSKACWDSLCPEDLLL